MKPAPRAVVSSLLFVGTVACSNVNVPSPTVVPPARAEAQFEAESGATKNAPSAMSAVVATDTDAELLGKHGKLVGVVRARQKVEDYGVGLQGTKGSNVTDSVAAKTAADEGATHIVFIESGKEAALCQALAKPPSDCHLSAATNPSAATKGGRVYAAVFVPESSWASLPEPMRPQKRAAASASPSGSAAPAH